MLTNQRNAFRGQSRSPNTVPYDILGMVSYQCAIVTLSTSVFEIFDIKNAMTSKTGLEDRQGHWKCHLFMSAYDFLLTFYSNYGSISCRFWHIQCQKISQHSIKDQSRSLTVVPFDRLHSFLLVFFSNFVPKTYCFWDIRLQKCCDIENQVRDPSTALEMSPFDIVHMTSCWCFTAIMALSRVISKIFNVEKHRDLEIRVRGHSMSLKWYHSKECVWFPINVL